MTTVVLIYIVLLIIFFVFSGLIFRHMVKFGYLSQKFKTIILIFGLMATAIIVFSLYMLLQLRSPNPPPSTKNITPTNSTDLNF